MENSMYKEMPDCFYDNLLTSVNPVSRAYHEHRYAQVRGWLSKYNLGKKRILDIGCGSCTWNSSHLPVTGFDISKKHIRIGLRAGRLKNASVGDFEARLPFPSGSFDVAIMTEVLEHLDEPGKKLAEVRRVLGPGGRLIVTVPFDSGVSLWRPLCAAQCAYMGHVRGMEFYRRGMGHVNHFGRESLTALLEENGFEVVEADVWLLFNLAAIARRA